jgi:putative membrane protein
MTMHLPTLNATLNGLAGICLFLGWMAIRAGRRDVHQRYMTGALICSAVFLCSYVTYHALNPGVTRYQGEGISRIIYFSILLTHTPLAALVVPFSIAAVWHAIRKNFQSHVKITRWLLPIWMYVSVSGVVVYLMLYIF